MCTGMTQNVQSSFGFSKNWLNGLTISQFVTHISFNAVNKCSHCTRFSTMHISNHFTGSDSMCVLVGFPFTNNDVQHEQGPPTAPMGPNPTYQSDGKKTPQASRRLMISAFVPESSTPCAWARATNSAFFIRFIAASVGKSLESSTG